MLKILFFIETLSGGGAEKVLIDLVNHMDKTRFDITVQTLWPSETGKKLANRTKADGSVVREQEEFNRPYQPGVGTWNETGRILANRTNTDRSVVREQ